MINNTALGQALLLVNAPVQEQLILNLVTEECACLELEVKFKNYSLICTHAATERKSETETDQFYETLERMYKQCPSYYIKIILCDMNAKVGKKFWIGTAVGACDLPDESNDNRTCLINYAVHQHMAIRGTLFPHRNIYKGTWHGPHDRTVNHTDHVLIDQHHHSNLLDTRSYTGANADSDQHLVVAGLRYHIGQRNNKKIPKAPLKYKTESLATKATEQEHINKLVNEVQVMDKNNLNWAVLQ
jgi:hypothetical protein